jgi:hypothetical protein
LTLCCRRKAAVRPWPPIRTNAGIAEAAWGNAPPALSGVHIL